MRTVTDRNIFLRSFEALLSLFARLCTLVASLALVVLIASFGWLVFGRYILNDTPTWVEQLALVLMLVMTFMAAAVGVREDTHLAVETLPNLSSPPVRKALYAIKYLAIGGFGIIVAVESIKLVEFGWRSTIPLLGWPEGIRNIPIATFGALIFLFSVSKLIFLILEPDTGKGDR